MQRPRGISPSDFFAFSLDKSKSFENNMHRVHTKIYKIINNKAIISIIFHNQKP